MIQTITTAGYIVIVLTAVAVELRSQFAPDRIAPFGVMLGHYSYSRVTRIGLLASWWWFGWHFFFATTVQTEL